MNKVWAELSNTNKWKTFSSEGENAHFYHANGFPLGCYAPLIEKLSKNFSLSALEMRPTWEDIGLPTKNRNWQLYADDLISHLEKITNKPVVGIGHSMGATSTIMAAYKRPDLFTSLILIEPAMVSFPLSLLVKALPKSVMNLVSPARNTLRKTDTWSSRKEFAEYCTNHNLYRKFDKESMNAFIQFGVRTTSDDLYKLRFPKIWESHNYTQPPNVLATLKQLTVPIAAIRGKPSIFFSDDLWNKWQKLAPQASFLENPQHGHLFPLENSDECSHLIEQAKFALSHRVK